MTVLTGVMLIIWGIRSQVGPILLIFVAITLVTTIVSAPWLNIASPGTADDDGAALSEKWRREGPFNDELPIVLHIIVDEMVSSGAIDTSSPAGAVLQDAMYSFADRHGFRMFDSVYSRFFYSGISIPNSIDAEYEGRTAWSDLSKKVESTPVKSAYFADMAARGYRTAVFQTAVLNFCLVPQVRLCETFPSFDPGVADESQLDEQTRSLYLWDTLLRAYEPSYLSMAGRWLMRTTYGLDQRELGVLGTADRFDVQGFPGWFDRFNTFVFTVPRGSHVFTHLMVPHAPYLLSEECVVSGVFDAGYHLSTRFEGSAAQEEARRKYQQTYYRQATCVLAKLDQMMVAISSAPAFHDATVVIHGDHGARISAGALIEDLAPEDFISNYATFFAVKAAAMEPGVDCTFSSLPQVLRSALGSHRAELPDGHPLPLIVSSRAGADVKVEAPMPLFGCAAGQ